MAWITPVDVSVACILGTGACALAYVHHTSVERRRVNYDNHMAYVRKLEALRHAALRDGRDNNAARLQGRLDAAEKFGPRALSVKRNCAVWHCTALHCTAPHGNARHGMVCRRDHYFYCSRACRLFHHCGVRTRTPSAAACVARAGAA